MRRKTVCLLAAFFIFLPLLAARAQAPTSRLIPFSLPTSLPPSTTQEVVVEMWDSSSGGTLIFAESYTGASAGPGLTSSASPTLEAVRPFELTHIRCTPPPLRSAPRTPSGSSENR